MKKFSTLFFALMIASMALSSCGSDQAVTAPIVLSAVPPDYAGKSNPLGPDAAVAGAVVFKTNCASCHGDTGHGDGPASTALDPRPANLVQVSPAIADDFLYWRINTGKEGTSMPAWKGVLDDEQIWQVIAFIRTLK